MTNTPRFIHLRVHTEHSLLEGAVPVKKLVKLVAETGLPFILTQTYTGYPMVREARALIAAGRIGSVRHVQVEYLQDWLAKHGH